MWRLPSTHDRSFSITALFFARCGYDSMGEIAEPQERSREYFAQDLRDMGARPLREVNLAIIANLEFTTNPPVYSKFRLSAESFDLFVRQSWRQSAKDPIYAEICMPPHLSNWKIDHGLHAPWAKHDQEMRNAIFLEIPRGNAPKQAIYHKLSYLPKKKHWLISTSSQGRAPASRRSGSRSYRESWARQCFLRAVLFYAVRLLVSAELAGALAEFGGIQAQFGLSPATSR